MGAIEFSVREKIAVTILIMLLIAIPFGVTLLKTRTTVQTKAAADGSVIFSPQTVNNIQVGDDFNVDLVLNNTASLPITGEDVVVSFNNQTLQLMSITPRGSFDLQIYPGNNLNAINALGTVRVTGVNKQSSQIKDQSLGLATLTFKALNTGQTSVSVSNAEVVSSCRSNFLSLDLGKTDVGVSPSSALSEIVCNLSQDGQGTAIDINGANIGPQGNYGAVKINDRLANILSWQDTAVNGVSDTKIKAQYQAIFSGVVPIQVTTNSQRVLNGSCQIGLSAVEVFTQTVCRPPDDLSVSNVQVTIYHQEATGSAAVYQAELNIDESGVVQGLSPTLQSGQDYSMLIKTPITLARRINFTAGEGTTILSNIDLPVGDIAPTVSTDGVVNVVDRSELIREWNLTDNTTQSGDFNLDQRINSFDWACMRNNFGQQGQP